MPRESDPRLNRLRDVNSARFDSKLGIKDEHNSCRVIQIGNTGQWILRFAGSRTTCIGGIFETNCELLLVVKRRTDFQVPKDVCSLRRFQIRFSQQLPSNRSPEFDFSLRRQQG